MTGKAVNHRLWMPLAIGGLALASIVILLLQRDLDHNFKCWYMSVTVLLAVLLEFVWFVFLSRFTGRRLWSAPLLHFRRGRVAGFLVALLGYQRVAQGRFDAPQTHRLQ